MTPLIPVAEVVESLAYDLKVKGDTDQAVAMSRYMKNKYAFFGVQSFDRKTILKQYKKQAQDLVKQGYLEELILQLWEYEEREMQYCAIELMDASRKFYTPQTIDLIERLILQKSWWDTVDVLAEKMAGKFFLQYPDLRNKRINEWINHTDFWLNRSAILHQLGYRHKTDFEILKDAILPHILSPEFFIRKAIGWALRQYSKFNPKQVIQFVQDHPELSGLSKKEALRLISNV